jgi:exopolyphosphatase/guanosine-5'-triphosphate,3'-diphosphate pyrophosphatase
MREEAVKTGIIDIGSNTIHLTIFEHETDGAFKALLDDKIFAGLVRYAPKSALTSSGADTLCESLRYFGRVAQNLGVTDVRAFATASLRDLINQSDILSRAKDETGMDIEVISGEDEARLSFLGAQHYTNLTDALVADIGGASTELIRVKDGKAASVSVLPDGCLSLRVKYIKGVPAEKNEISRIKKAIRANFDMAPGQFFEDAAALCCIGGTARAAHKLARTMGLLPDPSGGLPVSALRKMARLMAKKDPRILEAVDKAIPERFFSVLPGALILKELAKRTSVETIIIAKGGVREGYLIDRIVAGISEG